LADYSVGSKLLHHLALSIPAITEASFDIEWLSFGGHAPESQNGEHIFVSGLARAGTTILMESLYSSNAFSSLTYADMPFVLAPNLGAKIRNFSPADVANMERAHGDGVLINVNSPEALEEVFWRVFSNQKYIKHDKLINTPVSNRLIKLFRRYVSLILLKHGKKRYLSKNNNNILRFSALLKAFPRAKIIVPFRNPASQAISLYRQHQSFIGQQKNDAFMVKYMTWLAHHEFGLTHKPFFFRNCKSRHNDPDSFDYWLRSWLCVYQHVLSLKLTLKNQIVLFDYDLFCKDPLEYFRQLSKVINLEGKNRKTITPPRHADANFKDTTLLAEALNCHDKLKKAAIF